ncbi:MAG: MOSC domain-containing protein [Saprospiraceae bacterium]|nr:MOSC domain-containing protein [Saprospiraceae bacterium]
MMHIITDLIIYPIKSLAGIPVQHANALRSGFQHDRRWMLLDEDNVFLTQREIPELALFAPEIKDDKMSIRYQNEHFFFDISETSNVAIPTKVFTDDADTMEVSRNSNQWFSDMLKKKVRLVHLKDDQSRQHYNKNKNEHIFVSLADGYPYLLAGHESLDHLNRKLQQPLAMNRFRPNMVVTSSVPHEEDEWGELTIGSAKFLNMKPCGRCKIITINQTTTVIDNEPLTILNTYRKAGHNVMFGTNMTCVREGMVHVGDTIYRADC